MLSAYQKLQSMSTPHLVVCLASLALTFQFDIPSTSRSIYIAVMAYNSYASPLSQTGPSSQYLVAEGHTATLQRTDNYFDRGHRYLSTGKPVFDTLRWYPHYLSCQRYFLDRSQYLAQVQTLAAFMNIQLPYQKQLHPHLSNTIPSPGSHTLPTMHPRPSPFYSNAINTSVPLFAISLIPYIRRLVATGQDNEVVMASFFGNAWRKGIGEFHECERRNYLFTSRSMPWYAVKQAYDMSSEETCPFLLPLGNTKEEELLSADSAWKEWMAHEDWMLGPRRPEILATQT